MKVHELIALLNAMPAWAEVTLADGSEIAAVEERRRYQSPDEATDPIVMVVPYDKEAR